MKVTAIASGLLMAIAMPVALATPAQALGSPVQDFQRVSPSVTGDLPCYMHTSEGYSLDLTPLCPSKQEKSELTVNDLVAKYCQAIRQGATPDEAGNYVYAFIQTEIAQDFGGDDTQRMMQWQKYSTLMEQARLRVENGCS